MDYQLVIFTSAEDIPKCNLYQKIVNTEDYLRQRSATVLKANRMGNLTQIDCGIWHNWGKAPRNKNWRFILL